MTPEEEKQYDELVKLEQDLKFKNLCEMLEGYNILSFFEVEKQEIKHSKAIAKLLDSSYPWKDYFIEKLMKKVNISLNRYDDFDVKTEYPFPENDRYPKGQIDIMLVSDTQKIVILIENKVDSGETGDQLSKYTYAISNHSIYKDYTQYFIFLTKDGTPPKNPNDKNWKKASYVWLIKFINKYLDDNKNSLSEDIEFILKQYVQFLRRKVIMDTTVMDLCRKLCDGYPEAIEALLNFRKNNMALIDDQITSIIDNLLKDKEKNGEISDFRKNSSKGKSKYIFTFRLNEMKNNIAKKRGMLLTAGPIKYTICLESAQVSEYVKDQYYIAYGEYDKKIINDPKLISDIIDYYKRKGTVGKTSESRVVKQEKGKYGIRIGDVYNEKKKNIDVDEEKIKTIVNNFVGHVKELEENFS